MGCDIHIYAEVRTGNGEWHLVEENAKPLVIRCDRNYYLFAMLAGVRGGRGIVPFSEARGVPPDASDGYRRLAEEQGEHSFSHWTLEELLQQKWRRTNRNEGIIPLSDWIHWKSFFRELGEAPPMHAQAVGGAARVVSPEEAERLLSAGLRANDPTVHVRDFWTSPYHRLAAGFWSEVMPVLLGISLRGGFPHRDVRMVFWFDS